MNGDGIAGMLGRQLEELEAELDMTEQRILDCKTAALAAEGQTRADHSVRSTRSLQLSLVL